MTLMKRKALLEKIKKQSTPKESLTIRVDKLELDNFKQICEKEECSMGAVLEELIKKFNSDLLE